MQEDQGTCAISLITLADLIRQQLAGLLLNLAMPMDSATTFMDSDGSTVLLSFSFFSSAILEPPPPSRKDDAPGQREMETLAGVERET